MQFGLLKCILRLQHVQYVHTLAIEAKYNFVKTGGKYETSLAFHVPHDQLLRARHSYFGREGSR